MYEKQGPVRKNKNTCTFKGWPKLTCELLIKIEGNRTSIISSRADFLFSPTFGFFISLYDDDDDDDDDIDDDDDDDDDDAESLFFAGALNGFSRDSALKRQIFHFMRKPIFCLFKNKNRDQLCSNCSQHFSSKLVWVF